MASMRTRDGLRDDAFGPLSSTVLGAGFFVRGDVPIDRIDITLESSSLVGTAAHLYVVLVVIAARSLIA